MEIQMADVTVHIDPALPAEELQLLEAKIRDNPGVISVHREPNRPHLMLVEYNPAEVDSQHILESVAHQGVNAELVGL